MSEINNSKLHEVNYKVNYSKLNFLFSGTEKENYGTHQSRDAHSRRFSAAQGNK